MLILLDSADLHALSELIPQYPVDGVTTNPTIIGRSCSAKREISELLQSIQHLIGEGRMLHIQVTATAVFTPQQALIAAKAGADFVAPYLNRLDDLAIDGSRVVSEIKQILHQYSLNTRVLAASFKNIEQIHQVCLSGADALTVSPELYKNMLFHPLTNLSVDRFEQDWAAIPGSL